MRLNFATLTWYAKYYANKLGVWGWLGVMLMLLSYAYYQSTVKALQVSTNELYAEKQRVESQLNTIDEVPVNQPETIQASDDDIANFYERFPTVDALPSVLKTINHLALKQNIVLKTGDYKLDKLKQKSNAAPRTLTKYQISFPVTGRYQNVRRFTANVLNKLPGIALVDMQIKRELTTQNQVEVSLIYVLFVKGASW